MRPAITAVSNHDFNAVGVRIIAVSRLSAKKLARESRVHTQQSHYSLTMTEGASPSLLFRTERMHAVLGPGDQFVASCPKHPSSSVRPVAVQ